MNKKKRFGFNYFKKKKKSLEKLPETIYLFKNYKNLKDLSATLAFVLFERVACFILKVSAYSF